MNRKKIDQDRVRKKNNWLPERYHFLVMPLLLSVFMTCIVSFISTVKALGWPNNFMHLWLVAWSFSWVMAYPTLLLILPIVKRLTSLILGDERG